MNTLIIIPAFNAAKHLPSVLSDLPLEKVLVINDGSTDDTRSALAHFPIKYLEIEKNEGVGNALRIGINFAKSEGYTHAITIDADGQHDPLLWGLFEESLAKAKLVTGNRFHDISSIPHSKIASNLFASAYVNIVFNKKIFDVSCGYRGFDLSLCDDLESYSNSYGFLYDFLFDNIGDIAHVPIPCIYNYDELLSTRVAELVGFLQAIMKHANESQACEIKKLLNSIQANQDIHLTVSPFEFHAFRHNDSYIFQTNPVATGLFYG